MRRLFLRSIAAGLAAALLWIVLGLVADTFFEPPWMRVVASEARAAAPAPRASSRGGFTVMAAEDELASRTTDDPYLFPSGVGILIIASALVFRRSR